MIEQTQSNQKNKGGRPPLTTKSLRKYITLTLREGVDDDLIQWFDLIPKGEMASSIKMGLRQGGVKAVKKAPKKAPEIDELMNDDMFGEFLSAF